MVEKELKINVDTNADLTPAENLRDVLRKLKDEVLQLSDQMKHMGSSGANSNRQVATSTSTTDAKLKALGQTTRTTSADFKEEGRVGVDAHEKISAKTDETAKRIQNLGKVASQATSSLNKIHSGEASINRLGSSVDKTSTKFGGLRGRIQSASHSLDRIQVDIMNFASVSHFAVGVLENFFGALAYDLFNGFVTAGRGAINAEAQLKYFSDRLEMSSGEFSKFRTELEGLQKDFRKVDMKAVGATAEEIAVKNGIAKENIGDLTKMTAVLSSTFVKEGRTQEDAVLAVADALDGQFARLQEIGIKKQDLINDKWKGDLNDQEGLIASLNQVMAEMGYEKTAKDITSLDEAINALSISGGNLLASFIIPFTPMILDMTEAIISTVDGIKGLISGFMGVINNLPPWAKEALDVGELVGAIILLTTWIVVSLVPAISGALMSAMVSLGSTVGITIIPELTTLSGAFMTLAGAIWATIAPLLPFIIIGALIAVAIYEIGKAFGWWHDIGSLIEAISAGVQRLWSAFINNPNVKATIQDVKEGLNSLGAFFAPLIQGAQKLWSDMFPPGTNVDIVRMIIDAFGTLGDILGKASNWVKSFTSSMDGLSVILVSIGPIGIVIEAFRRLYCIIFGCSPGVIPALQALQQTFNIVLGGISAFVSMVIGTIVSIFNNLVATVQGVIRVFSLFLSGQINLQQTLTMVWNIIRSSLGNIFNILIGNVTNFASSFVNKMVNGATTAVNNFTNQISRLPNRLQSELTQMLSAVNRWASTLPQKFWNAGVDAVKNFLSALGIASPGTMQRMLVWEISEMGRRVPEESRTLLSNVNTLGTDIVDEFGNPTLSNKLLLESVGVNNPNNLGNNYDFTINIGSVDSEDRVNEIVEAIRNAIAWDNTTAGRTV